MPKKQFIVEIDIPEATGDLCWDHDETGLQAFHDCVITALAEHNSHKVFQARNEEQGYKDYIQLRVDIRESFRVVRPLAVEEYE